MSCNEWPGCFHGRESDEHCSSRSRFPPNSTPTRYRVHSRKTHALRRSRTCSPCSVPWCWREPGSSSILHGMIIDNSVQKGESSRERERGKNIRLRRRDTQTKRFTNTCKHRTHTYAQTHTNTPKHTNKINQHTNTKYYTHQGKQTATRATSHIPGSMSRAASSG
jgi:hypothetical protein